MLQMLHTLHEQQLHIGIAPPEPLLHLRAVVAPEAGLGAGLQPCRQEVPPRLHN
jgi:hypothetical protein